MPVKIKKIPQPAPQTYMPPPGMEPPSYMQPPPGVYAPTTPQYMPPPGMVMPPPPGVYAPTTPQYMPPPGMEPPAYMQRVGMQPPPSDNIITHTEYEILINENKPELVMLKSPNKDKLLEQVNPNVFDQMQKIIDNINTGHDYVKKTKILLAKLEHFPYLRKYENLIRKATHLDGESDPHSLEKLQSRVCNDPWLALFFKKADETRISRPFDKKLTLGNWIRLKQTIMGYYFNFFLQKKHKQMIIQDKLPSFCARCLRMNRTTTKFAGFTIYDIVNKVIDAEPIYLSKLYLEQAPMHKDDFAIGKYSDIFDLLKSANYKFEDDKDNEDVVKSLKEAGAKDISAIVAAKSDDIDYIDDDVHWWWPKLSWIGLGGYEEWGTDANGKWTMERRDGAAIVSLSKTTTDSDGSLIIGTIRKIADNNYQQTGFFYTLCLFVDEALENCRQQYEARNGPINWDMTSQMADKAVNLSDLVKRNRMMKELNEILNLLPLSKEKSDIDVRVCKMSISDYTKIREDLDNLIDKELIKFVKDPTTKDLKTVVTTYTAKTGPIELQKNEQLYNKLTDKGPMQIKWKDLFADTTGKTWIWNTVAESVFADGRASTPDGGPHKSPTKSKKPSYKRSPQYDGLKSAYKDGRISKDAFKDGKREIKRSFRRGPRA